MTYRPDSDIYFPYGVIEERTTNYTLPTLEEVSKKSHKIAWFVSNCKTMESEIRKMYVEELKKYISVHVYGKCGNYSCTQTNKSVEDDPCYKMLEEKYKFYLSFENSFCDSYVTEKMFNILQKNVIPIVMGGSNYSKIAPPMSVINVDDFETPKDLAEYLHELDSNYDKYVKYFKWKYKYVARNYLRENVLCQLCEMLNKPVQYTSYKNIKKWFEYDCREPEWLLKLYT